MNMNNVVISAALTGGGHVKAKGGQGNRPLTPEAIAADVVACAKAGAAICHIHTRDENGNGTMNLERTTLVYETIQAAVKEAGVDVIINLTTSGGSNDDELRVAHLKALRPEMCSYDAGSINWNNDSVFLNTPKFLKKLGQVTIDYAVKPEIEIFDTTMIKNAIRVYEQGCLAAPLHFQLVLGTFGGMDATVDNLLYLRNLLPEGCTYSVTGIGVGSVPMIMAALAMGADGIRVGLEDNLYMSKGVFATNAQQVERAVKLVELTNRKVATAAEARELLHFPKR